MATWKEWFDGQVTTSTMRVEGVSLSVVGGGWGLQDEGQWFGRQDGKFFDLVGAKITTGEREVRSWGQPLLREASGPSVVVLASRYTLEGHFEYLVSAKAEPGNETPGCLLLAPSLQASQSNLGRDHGGKRPPRAELFDRVEATGHWRSLRKDGARFFGKIDRYAVIKVGSDIELASNERWFTAAELVDAAGEGLLNEHLVTVLALGVCLV